MNISTAHVASARKPPDRNMPIQKYCHGRAGRSGLRSTASAMNSTPAPSSKRNAANSIGGAYCTAIFITTQL